MKKLTWKTEKRKVSELIPLAINPRKISPEKLEKLKANMDKFNVVEIPVIDIDNQLITYHQRIKALIALGRGEESIDVRIPNRKLSEAEIKEYNIIANTHAGSFDMDMFDEFFGDVDLESIGVSLGDVDFTVKMDEFLEQKKAERKAALAEAEEDNYEIPDFIQTDIVEGDLFEIGRHRLLCGSSRIWDDVARLMDGLLADICITDPPYNVAYVGKTKDALTIKNDRMAADEFHNLLYDAHVNIVTATKPGGSIYVFHADTEGETFRRAFREAGLKLSGCLVWVKQTMVMGRSDYQWKHEPVLYGHKAPAEPAPEAQPELAEHYQPSHVPVLYGWKKGQPHRWFADRSQTTVLLFNRPSRNEQHPTMKPIPLLGYFLENSSLRGETVLDLFGGSGSTMVTCEQLDRLAFLMELDPKFCQVIIDRMRRLVPDIQISKNGKPYDARDARA